MAVYRELFFNNLNSLLGKSFPVLRAILADGQWRRLVRAFMVHHRAHTPYFLEIPREFVEFLSDAAHPDVDHLPFLAELAHYEWAELALSVTTASDELAMIDAGGDLLLGVPVKSALAWPFSYRFPVHRISKKFQPSEPGAQPTCLVIYRKPDDDLGFMELNSLTAALLDRIAANEDELPGRELLAQLGDVIGYADPAALLEHGRRAMEEMLEAGILLGVRRA
jgi:hypothetical protein